MRSLLVLSWLLILPPSGYAAQRHFVKSDGVDNASCSITSPCRQFAAAVALVNPGGEVIALDSAGYGAVTIGKSVALIAPRGIYGGISVFSGDGVTLDGSGISVVLRGLSINGQGGAYGIRFVAGWSLNVEECEISNFASVPGDPASGAAIYVVANNTKVVVRDTVIRDSRVGIKFADGAAAQSFVDGAHFEHVAGYGYYGSDGKHTISNSVFLDVGIMEGAPAVHLVSQAALADAFITRSVISGAYVAIGNGAFNPGTHARTVIDANAINDVYGIVFFLDIFEPGVAEMFSPGNNTIGFYNNFIYSGSLTTPCCLH